MNTLQVMDTNIVELAPRINLSRIRVGSLITASLGKDQAHGLVVATFPHGIEVELTIFTAASQYTRSFRSKRMLFPDMDIELVRY